MAKISGTAYLIIGICVALISYFSKNPSLRLFIYIGSIFGLIGIIKILFTGISRKKEKPVRQRKVTHQHPIQRPQSIQHHKQFTSYCKYCGNIVRISDNFCNRCGHALHRRR